MKSDLISLITQCGNTTLWHHDSLWSSSKPGLTQCYQRTLLNWIPTIFLWLFCCFEFFQISRLKDKTIKWNRYNFSKLISSLICVFLYDLQFFSIFNRIYWSDESTLPYDLFTPLFNIASYTLILFLFYYHRLCGIHTSAVIWIYSFFQTLTTLLITYQTWIDGQNYTNNDLVLFNLQFIVTLSLLIITSFADGPILSTTYSDDDQSEAFSKSSAKSKVKNPEDGLSFLNKLTFWWFNEIIFQSKKKELTVDDLLQLPDDFKTENLYKSFEADLAKAKERSKTKPSTSVSLVPIIVKKFGGYFFLGFIFEFLNSILSLASPLLLKSLISFVEKKLSVPIWHGFMIAGAMFIVSMLKNIIRSKDSQMMQMVGEKISSIISASIFRKSLYLGDKAKKKVTSGEIVNLMTSDAQSFYHVMDTLNNSWSLPFRILSNLYLLYSELGYSAFIALFIMIGTAIVDNLLLKRDRKFYKHLHKRSDKRIESIYEILNTIRVIKFYAWEESFIKRTTDLRNEEMKLLRESTYKQSLSSFFWTFSSSMISAATFATYVMLQGGTLTAQKAFVSLNYLKSLQSHITRLPNTITSLNRHSLSIGRINEFLNHDELDSYVTKYVSEYEVSIENGSFKWTKKRGKMGPKDHSIISEPNNSNFFTEPDLKNINMNIKPGSFVAIVGSVGSGKSSLLSAILGEMEKVSGLININGKKRIAYVSQQAWIQNATLRDNILFENDLDKTKYKQVISACALEPDLAHLPRSDETEIGEKGVNLSGGQKQRVSLARACYSDADLYILDDPLSAVDAHVARHLFNRVLSSKTGLLANKTRILVTNKLDILSKVDYIYVLNNGQISETGTFDELMNSHGDFSELVEQFSSFNSVQETEENVNQSKDQEIPIVDNDNEGNKPTDSKNSSKVKWSVYVEYFKMFSIFWLSAMFITKSISACSSYISDLWLSRWSSDHLSNDYSPSSVKMRLIVYAALGLGQGILHLSDTLVFFNGSLNVALKMHQKLLYSIFRSPISFFDRTSTGTIITLFSRELNQAGSGLPRTILHAFSSLVSALSSCAVIFVNIPLFIFVFIPISLFYWFIQRSHSIFSRQLRRLSFKSQSPIYSYFNEALNGLNTIQAFNATDRFIAKFSSKNDKSLAQFYLESISRLWLNLRLDFCGNLISFFAVLFIVLKRESLDPGLVGLTLTYALTLMRTFSNLIRFPTQIESSGISIERLLDHCKLESEADWYKSKIEPDNNWPEKGSIKFDSYETRYSSETEPVLRRITADIKSKEKIGIVGRTGVGKSTMSLSLFRLIEPTSGAIYIDNYNISDLPLHPLRSSLAIIPQDPVLFAGSLRFNLDPFNQYSDEDIWSALNHVYLKDYFLRIGEQLNCNIDKDGSNLSVGQKQLLCLARALLKKPKILILDEATAAIDLETDDLIQKTIRSQFKNCTILTIAHRLHTILDSDRVIVLNNGEIVEFDKPKALLDKKDSLFYSLAKDDKVI